MSTRHSPQLSVAEIGIKGQELIRRSRVLIIGAGGLGTPVATYLAAAGLGNISIVDGDIVSLSNLHRQWLYTEKEVGSYKSETLRQKLRTINPEIQITAHNEFISNTNASSFISDSGIICDCTDNVSARLLIDETCAALKKPLVYAAVREWMGYLTILSYKNKTRLTDIFSAEKLKEEEANNCSITGIVGTTCGIVGSMQASEVLKIILGQELVLDGSLLCLDTLQNLQRILKIKRV